MPTGQSTTYREDYKLAVSMKNGDQEALRVFTRKHESYVLNWAKSRLRDKCDAEDLTNKIFDELWRYLIPRWDAEFGVFTTYFKRFVAWHINNEVKRLKVLSATVHISIDERPRPMLVETTTPEDAMLLDAKDAAIREAIDKAIAKVKVKDKRVKVRCWRLRNREGLFVREIAKITRLPAQKVSGFVMEINNKLRGLLDYEALMNLEV